jgi:hypothetical protein
MEGSLPEEERNDKPAPRSLCRPGIVLSRPLLLQISFGADGGTVIRRSPLQQGYLLSPPAGSMDCP